MGRPSFVLSVSPSPLSFSTLGPCQQRPVLASACRNSQASTLIFTRGSWIMDPSSRPPIFRSHTILLLFGIRSTRLSLFFPPALPRVAAYSFTNSWRRVVVGGERIQGSTRPFGAKSHPRIYYPSLEFIGSRARSLLGAQCSKPQWSEKVHSLRDIADCSAESAERESKAKVKKKKKQKEKEKGKRKKKKRKESKGRNGGRQGAGSLVPTRPLLAIATPPVFASYRRPRPPSINPKNKGLFFPSFSPFKPCHVETPTPIQASSSSPLSHPRFHFPLDFTTEFLSPHPPSSHSPLTPFFSLLPLRPSVDVVDAAFPPSVDLANASESDTRTKMAQHDWVSQGP